MLKGLIRITPVWRMITENLIFLRKMTRYFRLHPVPVPIAVVHREVQCDRHSNPEC